MTNYQKMLMMIVVLLLSYGCKFQTRAISRLTGSALQLELPEDFDRPISFSSGRKGEKDLFYYNKHGELRVKTYTDFGVLESEIVFINNK